MIERRKFFNNMMVQIAGFVATVIGGALALLGNFYIVGSVLHLSPVMSAEGHPPISIASLILKIFVLIILLGFLMIATFRVNKYRKDVFNITTGFNLRIFLLYSFLQGMLLLLISGFIYYTWVSTLTGA